MSLRGAVLRLLKRKSPKRNGTELLAPELAWLMRPYLERSSGDDRES